jgi:hypothetical protein
MNKPDKITGEWIKSEIEKAHSQFKANQSKEGFSTFLFHEDAKTLTDRITELRKICPHKANSINCCIYCGKPLEEKQNEQE